VIREWWCRWPDSLPAVPTGEPSDLWMLDLDVSGDGEPLGERSASELGITPESHPHAIRTRRDGWHLPYRWRADLPRNTAHRLPCVDSRSEGGYVVAWDAEPLIAAAADPHLPEPPAALVAALAPEPPPKVNGHDAVTISDRYVAAALDAECRAVGTAPEGMRNNSLNRARSTSGSWSAHARSVAPMPSAACSPPRSPAACPTRRRRPPSAAAWTRARSIPAALTLRSPWSAIGLPPLPTLPPRRRPHQASPLSPPARSFPRQGATRRRCPT
jgi:hypothetical protein